MNNNLWCRAKTKDNFFGKLGKIYLLIDGNFHTFMKISFSFLPRKLPFDKLLFGGLLGEK